MLTLENIGMAEAEPVCNQASQCSLAMKAAALEAFFRESLLLL